MDAVNEGQLLPLALGIVDRLLQAGYQAYLVGGFVRDRTLGKPIKDIDIATSARPETVLGLFARAVPTGLQHGTVTVVEEGLPFEVTTFRHEGAYRDHRRPEEVAFIDDLAGDLARRDFTMNAMAMDRDLRLIDPFGGMDDLRAGILRTVGDPRERFGEDALRMARCIRFAAEYGLSIDPPVWEALVGAAATIRHIAVERLRSELARIVTGANPGYGLQLYAESTLERYVDKPRMWDLTRLSDLLASPVACDELAAVQPPEARWPLLALLSGCTAAETARAMRAWTFPGKDVQAVKNVMALHETIMQWEASDVMLVKDWQRAMLAYDAETGLRWLALAESPLVEAVPGAASSGRVIAMLRDNGRRWLEEMPVVALADLAVNGADLLALGWPKGPAIGHVLQRLLAAAALGEVENERDALLQLARQINR